MTSCSMAARIIYSIFHWAMRRIGARLYRRLCEAWAAQEPGGATKHSGNYSQRGSTPLPATWISGQLLVGYDGFVANQNPRLNYTRYLMLTVEKGLITKREFQDRKLWDQ